MATLGYKGLVIKVKILNLFMRLVNSSSYWFLVVTKKLKWQVEHSSSVILIIFRWIRLMTGNLSLSDGCLSSESAIWNGYRVCCSDNYGFVTFAYKVDAYEAVEHGNDDPNQPHYDLCFGGRRAFCKTRYSDLGKAACKGFCGWMSMLGSFILMLLLQRFI